MRENYNEFAKMFVESGMKLITSDRPTADIMKDLQAEMTQAHAAEVTPRQAAGDPRARAGDGV